ncbi:MAG: hypothetical protein K6T73_11460 [Candidatus Bathyarchaeota archaeon]|nr:hypothetical protein [Candidatus Bathyarchaeota archaeon]
MGDECWKYLVFLMDSLHWISKVEQREKLETTLLKAKEYASKAESACGISLKKTLREIEGGIRDFRKGRYLDATAAGPTAIFNFLLEVQEQK